MNKTTWTAGIFALTLVFCAPAQAAARDIWLAPPSVGKGRPTAVDFADLFKPDAPWKIAAAIADLKRRRIAIAVEDGGPDRAIFQSWQPNPTHALPETAPATMTHLVDVYVRGDR